MFRCETMFAVTLSNVKKFNLREKYLRNVMLEPQFKLSKWSPAYDSLYAKVTVLKFTWNENQKYSTTICGWCVAT